MLEEMSKELSDQLDRLECVTVFGRVIDSDMEIKKYQFDETYPLRFHLRELSRFIWSNLFREGKREKDVLHAVNVVKREIVDYDPAGEETADNEETVARRIAEHNEDIAKHIADRKSLGYKDIYAETGRPPLRSWYIYTNPTAVLDCLEDDWLENKDLWPVEQNWTWPDINDFLALLAIDSALLHVEQGEPFKAAVWAARATDFYGGAFAGRTYAAAQTEAASALGKRGADVLHGPNRAAKQEAIRLFTSKTWKSQAQAARHIAREVSKTELTVLKWLYEFNKDNSAGKDTT
jgi:hypothetical protein